MSDQMTYDRRTKYVVTDARVAPHHFEAGTAVRWVQTSHHGDRHLFRGRDRSGQPIVQWLAAEDVTEAEAGKEENG